MRIVGAIFEVIGAFVFGRDLKRARRQNEEAAEKLDAALKEVLNK